MSEHRIRLRAGWDVENSDAIARIDLPTHWPSGLTGPIRLIRRIGRPRSQALGESIQLHFLRVPGLIQLKINRQDVNVAGGQGENFRVDWLGPWLDRNTLELEVDPTQFPVEHDPDGWGEIALVIVTSSIDPGSEG